MKKLQNKIRQNQTINIDSVMPRLLCFLFGHKKAIPMLNETNWAIFTNGCPRCGTHLGMPATWKNCPPPPNSNDEQLKSWEEYKLKHHAEIRASCGYSYGRTFLNESKKY